MKRLKRALVALVFLLAAAGCLFGAEAMEGSLNNFSIEQTYVNVPEMDIYLYATDQNGTSVSPELASAVGLKGTLGSYELDTSNIAMATGPVCYTFLLDNSSSMDQKDLQAYKSAINTISRNRGERDQVVVYTMAGAPQRIVGESDTDEELRRRMQQVELVNDSCDLLGAAEQAVRDNNTYYQSLAPRKVLFVCTSAVEVISNPALVAGLSSDLIQQLNMATFAFAATASAEKLNILGAFTKERVIPCETKELVSTILDKQASLANALHIKTTVPTSMGGQRLDLLTLSVPALGSAMTVSTAVLMNHIQATPQVTGLSVDSRTQITVTFNQAVDNADKPRNYTIRSEDAWAWEVQVKQAELSQDGRTAVLTTEPLYRGSYSLRLNKVSSRMTAANQSNKTKTLFPIDEWAHDKAFYAARFRLPMLVLAAVLALLALNVFFQSRRDRRNESAAEVQHLLEGEGAAHTALPKRWLTMLVQTRGELLQRRYSTLIEGSLMIGSDEALCDVCIRDHRLKPQHCILWVEGDEVYIRALDSSTVVLCNKERIGDAHLLGNNDEIKIGRTTIRLAL